MNGDTLYSIGELARRTGLPVRTIRFYSDIGVVPPTDRTSAGYRLYDIDALARLDLVRTLRDLGIDLATARRVLDHEVSVAQVATAHADALDVQIRTLRVHRAVLRAVASRGSSPKELELMHNLAQLSAEERRRIIDDFVTEAFGGLDANPELVDLVRMATPDLPEDPSPAQVDAWVELVELCRDPDFRAAVRRMAEYQARERARDPEPGSRLHHDLVNVVVAKVRAAIEDAVDPLSAPAGPILDSIVDDFATEFGRTPDADFRRWMVERFEVAADPRVDRYWRLLATINGSPDQPDLTPVFGWLITALKS